MRASPVSLVLFAVASLLSTKALAVPTVLVLNPEAAGEPYVADYSQAVLVKAALFTATGQPVVGERVSFTLRHGDDEDTTFQFDDPVTDAQGVATARLTLVDGRHGGRSFVAAAPTLEVPGERYVLGAAFQGDPFAEDCDGDAGTPDDAGADPDLCDAAHETELFLALETSTLVIQPGIEVELGDTVQILATLTDDNGDAEQAGTARDGTVAKPLSGRRVGFFYDLNGNGRPENSERVPCANTGETAAVTNSSGIAVCDFFADPTFVDTVNVADGIHAQFGGDDRYSLAGAAQAISVRAAPPDPARTLLEAEPAEAPADGFSLVALTATLVDGSNNTLSADDPLYDVRFETDLGTLEGETSRDPLTGQYKATLKAPRSGGDATVLVYVDDEQGASVTVTFVPQGCTCAAGSPADAALLGLLSLVVVLVPRPRAKRSSL